MFPVLFISHGAPDTLLSQDESRDGIVRLASQVPTPRAIVIVSAHWSHGPVAITQSKNPATIHDFGGFQPEMYQQQYPAKGDVELSNRVASLLQDKGIESTLDADRGLDHGAWMPLKLMYPEADIPVVQVSLPQGSYNDLVELGEALQPLRQEDVLIIGSGGSVHNLRELNMNPSPESWVIEFEQWLKQSIEGNRFDDLINEYRFPENFKRAHPTLEHYAPIVVAWAAADKTKPGQRVHLNYAYGNLGMSHYLFT